MVLSEPVAAVKGDRFIIRSTEDTLGGGAIIEPHPTRHRRFRPVIAQSLEAKERGTAQDIITVILEQQQPLEQAALLAQCGLPPSEALPAIDDLIQQKKVVVIGQGANRLLFTRPGWERLAGKAVAVVQDYHRRFPLRPGMPKAELASKLKLAAQYSAGALQSLCQESVLVEEGTAAVRLPSFQIRLTPQQKAKIDAFLQSLVRKPYAPPGDLMPEPDLLNLLIEQRRVVKVSESVVFAASAYDEMVKQITAYIKKRGKVSLAEVRDMFNTSRKYAQALLEHLDEKGITRRVGDERVLK
jgi:selenocysteine-specific elongation factor